MPDRLPNLIVLVGFWIPPAILGWTVAMRRERSRIRASAAAKSTTYATYATYGMLATGVVAYAAAWFYFNLHRMPPYIPGATMDPTVATPQAFNALAVFTSALILPGSALACALAFRRRMRMLDHGAGSTPANPPMRRI